MSVWEEPSLAPPEYLNKKVPVSAESTLKLYTSKLGLTPNTKRITPETGSQRRLTGEFSSKDTPASFPDPSIVRSEEWSSDNRNHRLTRFESRCLSCMTSIKCRFATLGCLLGILLSLGALIPILILRQTSVTQPNSAASSSSNTATSSSLITSTYIDQCNAYFCDERVIFITNMTTTAFSLNITVQKTGNASVSNTFNTIGSTVNSTYIETNTQIICTFYLQSGQLPAGNYTCAVQFQLSNQNHTSSLDTYSITTTNICGTVAVASGHF